MSNPPFPVQSTGKNSGLDWNVTIRGAVHHIDQNGTAVPPVAPTDQTAMLAYLSTVGGILTTNTLYTYCVYADPALSGNPSGRTSVIPGIPGPFDPNAPINKGGQAISGGISSVTDFLNKLVDPALWVRVGEFAVGAILLGVGLHAMTNGSSTAAAKKGLGLAHKSAHGPFQQSGGKPPVRSSRDNIANIRHKENLRAAHQRNMARDALKGL